MNTISVFDTSTMAYNIGNEIIMDAVISQIDSIFSNDFIIHLPIEDIGRTARKYNRASEYTFVGGTNVLNGDIRRYRQWDMTLHNILVLQNIVLMGCGWFQYESKRPTIFSRWAFSKVLSKNVVHSVRDSYTLKKCEELGLNGIRFVNTGCPTLWNLTDKHISQISRDKSDHVIFTITDYNHKRDRDISLISQIRDNYKSIFFFPQGTGDVKYLSSLGNTDDIKIIAPRLSAFDAVLDGGADYIGTRLHAGIRALQRKKRSFIVGIDNRAIEMSLDFGLPVLDEKKISELDHWINSPYELSLNIPWSSIKEWKNQFIR